MDLDLKSEALLELKSSEALLDLNNNANNPEEILLPPQSTNPVELLPWEVEQGWVPGGEDAQITPLSNLLVDPLFLPFDADSNKVDWEPLGPTATILVSSSDPFVHHHQEWVSGSEL